MRYEIDLVALKAWLHLVLTSHFQEVGQQLLELVLQWVDFQRNKSQILKKNTIIAVTAFIATLLLTYLIFQGIDAYNGFNKGVFLRALIATIAMEIALLIALKSKTKQVNFCQQEIEVDPYSANLEERDFEHNRLEEAGIFAGLQYAWKIDTKFDLGIKSTLYYTVSVNMLESITLTPTLTYHFQ